MSSLNLQVDPRLYLFILKSVIIILLLLSVMVHLSLDPLVVYILMQYASILTTFYILLINDGDNIASTANPGCFRNIHTNILLLLGHHFTGIIGQVTLYFICPVVSIILEKAGGFFSRNFR